MYAEKFSLESLPTVTVAIPVYNEEIHIENVIKRFLTNTYPNLIEILVADGGSGDRTQEIVKQLSSLDERVKLIINPQKIQSAALNLMISEAKGDIFLRADAHCDYADNYIEKCVDALLQSHALNVGGAQRFVATAPFQSGVALAARSLLSNGGAKYRDPNYDGYADTVYLGCFWKEALLDIATPNSSPVIPHVFDTSQLTNEDAELNQKLLAKTSEAIYISSQIQVWYYPRKTWLDLGRQYFKYGRGRYLTGTKHSPRKQLRGQLPFLIISLTILLLFVDLALPAIDLYIKELILLGLTLPFVESMRLCWNSKNLFASDIWRGERQAIPSILNRWLFCGIAIITIPFAHFSGYGYQLFRHKILRSDRW